MKLLIAILTVYARFTGRPVVCRPFNNRLTVSCRTKIDIMILHATLKLWSLSSRRHCSGTCFQSLSDNPQPTPSSQSSRPPVPSTRRTPRHIAKPMPTLLAAVTPNCLNPNDTNSLTRRHCTNISQFMPCQTYTVKRSIMR